MEPTPSEPRLPRTAAQRPRHTTAQRAVLALNIVVVVGCLAGAAGLVYGKGQLDNRLQTEKYELSTTVPAAPAGSTPDGNTIATVPPETFAPADPQAQNFLIAGSDVNACVEPNSQWAGAADLRRS